uniref:Uncharacterized protein n=1 Tax=Ciona savignyi TaxID=51511 RepID=H2YL14_CIOSA
MVCGAGMFQIRFKFVQCAAVWIPVVADVVRHYFIEDARIKWGSCLRVHVHWSNLLVPFFMSFVDS